jgi:hypothetical protein
MVGRILFIFGIQEFIHPRSSVPDEREHPAPKIGALQIGPKCKIATFSNTALMISIKFR